MFSKILQRFIEKSPVPVMLQMLIEKTLTINKLNNIFETTAIEQYTRTLLFSSLFDLMSLVVFKTFPNINAAYKEEKENLGVSITSVYNKLTGISTQTSSELVRQTSKEMAQIIREMKGEKQAILPGYRIKMIDGNCIEATEHRLEVLRETDAAPLPGKSLVVYDPSLEVTTDVFPCEDGHAQERSLFCKVLLTIEENDVLIADRNFCVRSFLMGIHEKQGYFIIREHSNLNPEEAGPETQVGNTDVGTVHEQWVTLSDSEGRKVKFRRIRIELNKATRNGEKSLNIVTNLPKAVANATLVCDLYRKRWNIETMFQELESHLHSEINTLGYPKAALFGFCVALVAYNALAVVKAGLRVKHGENKIENELSGYYLAGNIARTYDGMMIAVPEEEWNAFQTMSLAMFTKVFLDIAAKVNLSKYKKSKRGPKKTRPARNKYEGHPHVSTAKLIKGIEPNKKSP